MQICYVDEAGDTGAFDPTNPLSQPVLVLTGVFICQEQLAQLTRNVMLLKQRFFPNRKNIAPHWHDWLQVEVKGADLRRIIRDGAANEQRRVLRFLDQLLRLLERHGIQLTSRIYLKTALDDYDGTTTYSSAVQRFVETFEHHLVESSDTGIMILDSRNKGKNARVAHSVFTMKFRSGGTEYDRLSELPLFGHSECHALIQVADWVSSALLFPMAVITYCPELVGRSAHVFPQFEIVREKFGQRIKALQYRYEGVGNRKFGGITILATGKDIQRTAIFGSRYSHL